MKYFRCSSSQENYIHSQTRVVPSRFSVKQKSHCCSFRISVFLCTSGTVQYWDYSLNVMVQVPQTQCVHYWTCHCLCPFPVSLISGNVPHLPSCPSRNPEVSVYCFYLLRHLILEFVSRVSPFCDGGSMWVGTWSINSGANTVPGAH